MLHPRRAAQAPTRRLSTILATACAVAACGGGGDAEDAGTDSASASAEGFYVGTAAGGSSNYFEQLVLENNEVWLVLGTRPATGAIGQITTVMGGSATYAGGTLTAGSLKDFGTVPAGAATLSASYKTNSKSRVTSVAGTTSAGGRSQTLTGNDNVSNYNYDVAAGLSALTGTWTYSDTSGLTASVSVNPAGAFSLNVGGCTAAGTMAPRPSGKNVYNVTLTFGGAPCASPGVAFGGVAYVIADTFFSTSAGGSLRMLARNGAQTSGFMLTFAR